MKAILFNTLMHRYAGKCTFGFSRLAAKHLFFADVPHMTCKIALATLSFDIDYERDVLALPLVMDILNRFELKASFACVGMWARKYKDLHRDLAGSGHEILNHSYSHPDNEELNLERFSRLSFEEQRQEIIGGHRELSDAIQADITGFRTPHFGNQHVYSVYIILKELNYRYSSSLLTARANGLSSVWRERRTGIIEIPVATVPGKPWASFDSWNYFNKANPLSSQGRSMVRDYQTLVEYAAAQGGYVNVYFDPADFASRKEYLEICRMLSEMRKECRVVTYKDLLAGLVERTEGDCGECVE